jgi:CheY-like chemotaxis protein
VVDDEADVLRSMSRLLSARGFEVATASSGHDALGRLDAGLDVDAVLSDVTMPGITGPALVHRLRSERPGLPVVLVTGYGADLVDGLPEDVLLLAKPLETEHLVSTLTGLLAAWAEPVSREA